MATINLATKYEKKLDERFKLSSVTDAYAGKQYDFEGVNAIKIWTIDQVPINDYNRNASASRFGTINELGDTVQTLVMTQDKSYTFAIDAGNAGEQYNIKHCNAVLKQVWDEQVTPEIDAYRLNVWASGAGLVTPGAALTKDTVVEALLTGHAAMSNKRVPKGKARVTFISETLAIQTKLATNLQNNEKYTTGAILNGQIGVINGSPIVAVPDDLLPAGVQFMIKYKGATVDPMKRKVLRVQTHPLGFDADVGEGRYIHDSFVLAQKINGLYVYANTANAAVTPTIAIAAGGEVTLTATGSDGIKYTLDGTNPKTSDTAKVYASGSKPNAAAGVTVKAYAYKSGLLNSGVAESVSAG